MKIRSLHSRTSRDPYFHQITFNTFSEKYCRCHVRQIYRRVRVQGLSPANARYVLVDLLALGELVDRRDFLKDDRHSSDETVLISQQPADYVQEAQHG